MLHQSDTLTENDLNLFLDKYYTLMTPIADHQLDIEFKKDLCQRILKIIDFDKDNEPCELISLALKTLRILSREKIGFESCLNQATCNHLCKHAGLGTIVPESYTNPIVIESLKCLHFFAIHVGDYLQMEKYQLFHL